MGKVPKLTNVILSVVGVFVVHSQKPCKPSPITILQNSNLEITWYEFSGQFSDVLLLALKQRCYNDGLSTDKETLAIQFHLHLHRGIRYLAGDPNIKKIKDLIKLVTRDVLG
jgi:DNA sulfur modification protein DndE